MTKLGSLGVAGLLVFGVFAACSGDEQAKKAQDEEAGAAGMPGGADPGPDPGAGGSEMTPSGAGQGGESVVVGGTGGSGGVPAADGGVAGLSSAEGGQGGAQGGAASYDCPAVPGTFTYECALVAENFQQALENWSPSFDAPNNTFHLDVSALPFPIASGHVAYIYHTNEGEFCGTNPVTVLGDDVSINIGGTAQNIHTIEIVDFKLVDVCGQHQDYDPVGVACWRLTGSGEAGFDMVCEGASGPCPASCG